MKVVILVDTTRGYNEHRESSSYERDMFFRTNKNLYACMAQRVGLVVGGMQTTKIQKMWQHSVESK